MPPTQSQALRQNQLRYHHGSNDLHGTRMATKPFTSSDLPATDSQVFLRRTSKSVKVSKSTGGREALKQEKARQLAKLVVPFNLEDLEDPRLSVKAERTVQKLPAKATPAVKVEQSQPGYIERVGALDPMQRVRLVKEGVPSQVADQMAKDMGLGQKTFAEMIGVAPATFKRRLSSTQNLPLQGGASTVFIARLIDKVNQMLSESGEPSADFDAAAWVAQWLQTRSTALGGQAPAELLSHVEGQALVWSMLSRMQSGAYS